MRGEEVLERYVRAVAGQLPVRMRSDVSLELASLLREDMLAKAEALGHAPDEKLALDVVRDYGHPDEVAARYHPRWPIIDPLDTRNFVLTVIVGGAIVIAGTMTSRALTPERAQDSDTALLWWIGVTAVFFAIRSWMRRRRPDQFRWKAHKRDPDRVSRVGTYALVLVIGISIAIFADPQRTSLSLTGRSYFADWLAYDPEFRASRLPWLFAIWIAQGALLAMVAARGRWSPLLRRFELVLSAAYVVLFAWYWAAGPIMADPAADLSSKTLLTTSALVMSTFVGLKLYRQAGQVSEERLQEALKPASR